MAPSSSLIFSNFFYFSHRQFLKEVECVGVAAALNISQLYCSMAILWTWNIFIVIRLANTKGLGDPARTISSNINNGPYIDRSIISNSLDPTRQSIKLRPHSNWFELIFFFFSYRNSFSSFLLGKKRKSIYNWVDHQALIWCCSNRIYSSDRCDKRGRRWWVVWAGHIEPSIIMSKTRETVKTAHSCKVNAYLMMCAYALRIEVSITRACVSATFCRCCAFTAGHKWNTNIASLSTWLSWVQFVYRHAFPRSDYCCNRSCCNWWRSLHNLQLLQW